MTEQSLPAPYMFGRVIGRMVEAVGDISDADDPYPDMIPINGPRSITFTPQSQSRLISSGDSDEPTIKVRQTKIVADLDENGYLTRNGQPLWLWDGVWTVDLGVNLGGGSWPILIDSSVHAGVPLDLFGSEPYSPPPYTRVATLQVSVTAKDGQVLILNGQTVSGHDMAELIQTEMGDISTILNTITNG